MRISDWSSDVCSSDLDAGGINANTRTDYDAFGRVVRSVDGTGRATATAYPESGRSVVVTDPLQRTTRTDYDALGRALRVTDPLGRQTVHAARKRVVEGPRVSVRIDRGGCRIIKKKQRVEQ